MMSKPKRFIFDLSDELRARLERYRALNGLRSLSAALQHMIADAPLHVGIVKDGDMVEELRGEWRLAALEGEAAVAGMTDHYVRTRPAQPASPSSLPKTPAKPSKGLSEAPRPKAGVFDAEATAADVQARYPKIMARLSGPVGIDGKPLPKRGPVPKGGKK